MGWWRKGIGVLKLKQNSKTSQLTTVAPGLEIVTCWSVTGMTQGQADSWGKVLCPGFLHLLECFQTSHGVKTRKLQVSLQIWSSSLSESFTGSLDCLDFIACIPTQFPGRCAHGCLKDQLDTVGGQEVCLLILVSSGSLWMWNTFLNKILNNQSTYYVPGTLYAISFSSLNGHMRWVFYWMRKTLRESDLPKIHCYQERQELNLYWLDSQSLCFVHCDSMLQKYSSHQCHTLCNV